ncbi:MAG: T9SS type A sorting domain-containing protein [Ignavibacteriaceae bacterium]
MEKNYAYPFNSSTKISYQIPQIGKVSLKVFDLLGNEIATLVNEEKAEGTYETEFNAAKHPSGLYFYCLLAGAFTETKKMILLR